jgi:alpha-L-rhamnosidase
VRRIVVGLVAAMAGLTATVAAAAPVPSGSSFPGWPTHPDWQKYVVAPKTSDVRPVRIVKTAGSVARARSLLAPAGGDATLTMTRNGRRPELLVDYGKDVGGIPYFVVRSQSTTPTLRATYSEGLLYMGSKGDKAPSNSGAGDTSRVDDMTISSAGRFSRGLIQGGERFELITLTTPGSVTLSSVGIRFTAVRATARDFRGWFDSSSPELDRIWYDGAYTTQLDELPARTLPRPWRITSGVLETDGGNIGILRSGIDWSDYAMSFDTQVVDNEAGWMVRAHSRSSGYLFFLDDATDSTGTPDSLREIAFGPNEYVTIADVPLPTALTADSWHHVTTVASGTHITTSLDGRQLASFDTAALPAGASDFETGTVGFAALGTDAMFRHLDITGPGGTTLFANRLSQAAVLTDFKDPDVVTPDPLPVIMDGAKRDRVVWSGDLGVEDPNVFVTTASDGFVRGSLQLLAGYQEANGEAGTNVPPTVSPGTFPESGYNYSASYSMDLVDDIAVYYLYTGDLSFVRSQWPMITRQMAFDSSLVDSRGLLVTDTDDGLDWDYYDGSKTGEVTAYNDIYFQTLRDAATMAGKLGHPDQARTYEQDAAHLRAAINGDLLDPSTGLYPVSNLEPTTVAQDGTALAVLFGVAPAHRDAAILSALTKALPATPYGPLPFTATTGYRRAVSPFITNDEVEALYRADDTTAATSLLGRLWGHMDRPGPDGTSTDWELVGADGVPGLAAYTSLAHGWASGATADLSSFVLGVRPVTAGFSTWSVAPHPGSLSWAEGDVPTPKGTIDVRWAQDRTSRQLALQVSAPRGTRGSVVVPLPRTGAAVSIGRLSEGRTRTTHVTTAAGTRHLSVTVTGGTTAEIEVAPR